MSKLCDILLVVIVFVIVAAVLSQLPAKWDVCTPPSFPKLCVLGR